MHWACLCVSNTQISTRNSVTKQLGQMAYSQLGCDILRLHVVICVACMHCSYVHTRMQSGMQLGQFADCPAYLVSALHPSSPVWVRMSSGPQPATPWAQQQPAWIQQEHWASCAPIWGHGAYHQSPCGCCSCCCLQMQGCCCHLYHQLQSGGCLGTHHHWLPAAGCCCLPDRSGYEALHGCIVLMHLDCCRLRTGSMAKLDDA